MKLIRNPIAPTQMELASRAARMVPRRVHETWKPYLGITITPTSINSESNNIMGKNSKEEANGNMFIEDMV